MITINPPSFLNNDIGLLPFTAILNILHKRPDALTDGTLRYQQLRRCSIRKYWWHLESLALPTRGS